MITNGLPGVDVQIPSLGPRAARIGVRTGLISSSDPESVEGRRSTDLVGTHLEIRSRSSSVVSPSSSAAPG